MTYVLNETFNDFFRGASLVKNGQHANILGKVAGMN